MSNSESFLIVLSIIYTIPYFVWKVGKTHRYAPLVVIQIICGIVLGPSFLGAFKPYYYELVFNNNVIQYLNGISQLAVIIFVWIAGIELNLKNTWEHRFDSFVTAGFCLIMPLMIGGIVALVMSEYDGWIGEKAALWQFVLGIGISCSVTALPILILFMENLKILRSTFGQRILRYASIDDILIWCVLSLIIMDFSRLTHQVLFILGFAICAYIFRKMIVKLPESDRWYVSLIWVFVCSFTAELCGLHFMVGAFLAGVITNAEWIDNQKLDSLRNNVLLILMPIFFLNTGLKTHWSVEGYAVFIASFALLIAAIAGKLVAAIIAGKILKWEKGESSLVGWLLQTKALIMIIFANVLLDKNIITSNTFTALLLMALVSTSLTTPMVFKKIKRMHESNLVGRKSNE
jgi:Kef-type K+ transport system membrane component KefB